MRLDFGHLKVRYYVINILAILTPQILNVSLNTFSGGGGGQPHFTSFGQPKKAKLG